MSLSPNQLKDEMRGQDGAGRGVYREKELPFAPNGLLQISRITRTPGVVARSISWKQRRRSAERGLTFPTSGVGRLQGFRAEARLSYRGACLLGITLLDRSFRVLVFIIKNVQ